MAFDNLQYNVYRFFEYWQQGIDQIFGADNDNSNLPVECPYYRDGDIIITAGNHFFTYNGYGHNPLAFEHVTITSNNIQFFQGTSPVDWYPDGGLAGTWNDAAVNDAYELMVDVIDEYGFVFGMDENHVGEQLYNDTTGYYQLLRTPNTVNPLEIDKSGNRYYGTAQIGFGGGVFNLDQNFSSPFTVYNFDLNYYHPVVGSDLQSNEISQINNYYEYHNHYTEDGITVYYSDNFTFVTYDGQKTYNQVQNVVNNAYNNDNSVTIKINAPSYESLKEGNRHPYYIAPLQPLQIPELGEMSLPAGDFGDAPKILAESVNEMTGLLDHLGLTAIFIVCALLVFIIRKVRD